MTRYLARRGLLLIPVVLGAAVLAFVLLLLVPGDPAIALLGQDASVEEVARFRHLLGLDRPLLVQMGLYLARTMRGDLGRSVTLDVPVLRLIASTLPATLELALVSLVLAIGAGIPLGLVAARRRGRAIDTATMVLAQVGVSMPVFWLGVLLILLFAVRLDVLPSFGRGPALVPALLAGNGRAAADAIAHLVLPAFTLAFFNLAILSRLTRWALVEVLEEDYVRTARAKGQRERVVVYHHAFRNALLPIVTIVGLQFGFLLGGAVIAEVVFSWPGVGRLAVDSILARDYPVVQGCVLLVAAIFVLLNLSVDLLYGWLNPRIRYQ